MSKKLAKLTAALTRVQALGRALEQATFETWARRAVDAIDAAPGRDAADRLSFIQDICDEPTTPHHILTELANLLALFEPKKGAAGLTQRLVTILALAEATPDLVERTSAAAQEKLRRRRTKMERATQADIDRWVKLWDATRLDEEAFWRTLTDFKASGLAAKDQTAVVAAVTHVDKSRLSNKERRLQELERWHAHDIRERKRAERTAAATTRF